MASDFTLKNTNVAENMQGKTCRAQGIGEPANTRQVYISGISNNSTVFPYCHVRLV